MQSVYSNTNVPLSSSQKIVLAVVYTGNPVDITKITGSTSSRPVGLNGTSTLPSLAHFATTTPVIADIEIKLFNQDNQLVGDSILKDQSFLIGGSITIPTTLSGNANSVSAQVRVYKDDVTLSEYIGSVVYDKAKVLISPSQENNILGYAVALFILIIILIVLYLLKRIIFSKTMVFLLIGLFSVASFGVYISFVHASTFNVTGSSGTAPTVTGGPPASVDPGQVFPVNITISSEACSNADSYNYISGSFATSSTFDLGANLISGYSNYNGSPYGVYNDYSLGNFTAPTSTGIYNFNTSVSNSLLVHGAPGYWDQGVYADYCNEGDGTDIPCNQPGWCQTDSCHYTAYTYYVPAEPNWWYFIGSVDGYWPVQVVVPPPSTPSCGLATSTPSLSFPTSNLCGTGNNVSATSTNNSSHTWTCSTSGGSASCQTYRCSTGNKYCSTTNSCISNSSCCGGCTLPQTCQQSGGYGTCQDQAPTCSLPAITPTVTPSFVSDPSKTCTLKWNVTSNLQSGSGSCTDGIHCYVDNIDQTSSNSSGVTIPVGTHSLTCGSSLGTSTASVKCRVTPGFGEF